MQTLEITRDGGLTIAAHIDEMQRWLDREGIRATDFWAVRILKGRVTFTATFEQSADADRFLQAFGD